MELLGGYSDDSDAEQTPTLPVVTPAVHVPANTSKSNSKNTKQGPPKKKRKKLDISFLPENIQTALARGDTNRDSDSDDDVNMMSTKASGRKVATPGAPLLLSMLPKPKNDDIIVADKLDTASDEDVDYFSNKSKDVPREADSSSKVTSAGPAAVSVEDVDEESDQEEDGDIDHSPPLQPAYPAPTSHYTATASAPPPPPPNPSLPPPPRPSSHTPVTPLRLPSFSSAPEVQSTIHTARNTAPVIPTFTADTSRQPGEASGPPSTCGPSAYHTTSAPVTSTASTAVPMPRGTGTAAGAAGGRAGGQGATRKGAAARRRERDIHLSLLQGDVGALENGATFIDVQPPQEWDTEQYMMQQKRQEELKSMFNFSQKGGDNALSQPTKLQNRRHQINSLVFSAAESELELLEAKGRQMKTKYETQSKYGW